MFFERRGPVWDALHALTGRLEDAGVEYVVIGGMALGAHNYVRQTTDVDIVLTEPDINVFRAKFVGPVYEAVQGRLRRFRDPQTDVNIDVLIAGRIAGDRRRNSSVRFPHPSEGRVVAGLRTVSMERLIELKLVTWRHKDWGDVVELIRRNQLPESLGDGLDPKVRAAFGECYDEANRPDYEEPQEP